MSVISFDDWRKKKARASALTSRGALRADVSQREAHGFDLCIYIAEESAMARPDAAELDRLWSDLRGLIEALPKEHGFFYFSAFDAFFHGDVEGFYTNWDRYLESERRLFGEIAECDWWIDSFFWVFTPALPGMYARCGEMFHRYWPDCAISWVCSALDQNDADEAGRAMELNELFLALAADDKCYVAQFLVASIFYERGLYRSALSYYERASASKMYQEDAAFYFDYAWSAERAGRSESAIECYQACLALDESYPLALNNLGCVYMQQKKFSDAEACFQKAMLLELDGVLPYRNMVTLFEVSGRREASAGFIRKYIGKLGHRYQLYLDFLDMADERFEIVTALADEREDGTKAARKRFMEDWVESCAREKQPCFGRELMMVDDAGGYGRCYFVAGAGYIDVFCKNRGEQEYLVVAVNGGRADEKDLGRIIGQMEAIQRQGGRDFARITGVLFANEISNALRQRAEQLGDVFIELYEMDANCRKIV